MRFVPAVLSLIACSVLAGCSGSMSSTSTGTTGSSPPPPPPTTVTFGSPQTISTGFKNLEGLAVADFNGDGKPDIAVTDGYGTHIVVYLNDGKGGFSSPTSTNLTITNTTGTIVSGDFNEDGKQDLVVGTIAAPNQNILFLSGNGDGTFTQGNAIPGSFGMLSGIAGDLNHDSHLDLFVGGNGELYIFLGDGHGNFTVQPPSSQWPSNSYFAIAEGDFNQDGKIDLLAAGEQPSVIAGSLKESSVIDFYAGDGSGAFAAPVPALALTPTAPFAPVVSLLSMGQGDFNGDGKLDLLVGTSIPELHLGNGDGTFQSKGILLPTDLPPGLSIPSVVTVADMNGDGKPDALTADNIQGSVNVYLNPATGSFPAPKADFTATVPVGTGSLVAADLNGDGLPDIVLTNYKNNTITVFLSHR